MTETVPGVFGPAGDFVVAAALYASTLFFAPHELYLAAIALLMLQTQTIRMQARDVLAGMFIILAFANLLIHYQSFSWDTAGSSLAVPLVLVTAIASRNLRSGMIYWLVLFVCGEVAVGVFEFALGKVAVFDGQLFGTGQNLYAASDLLYERRVYGLSNNSSVFAEKVFLATILALYRPELFRLRMILIGLLVIGLYISFNRTAIIASGFAFLLLGDAWGVKKVGHRLLLFLLMTIVASFFVLENFDQIFNQFTRGTGGATYSEQSRLYFLGSALDYIAAHPIFGNGSLTFRIFDPITNTFQHAHNSVAMLFATHGPPLALLFLVFLARGWRKDTLVLVMAMAIFSATQYLFFWNISLADIVLNYLLRGRDTENAART